jgi:HEAT repeat protein
VANHVLVQGTLVLSAALVVTSAFRRVPAATRYALWLLALAALAVAPLIGGRAAAPPATDRDVAAGPSVVEVGTVPAHAGAALRSPPRRPPTLRRPTVPDGLLWIWAAGAAVMLLRLAADVATAARIRSDAVAADPRSGALFEALRAEVCPRRSVRLAVHPAANVPLVIGGMRPMVVLPPAAASWPAAPLRSALRHELAHVVRHDYATHLLSGVILALYWPTPLSAMARRRLDAEREAACDDRVIAWGTRRGEYARHLIQIAREGRGRSGRPATALAAVGSGVARRVDAVLSGNQGRRLTPVGWIAVLGIAAAVTLAVAAVSPLATLQEARLAEARAALSDPEAGTRRHAAWMLGELESLEDVGTLEPALADPAAPVRAAVAWALGEIKEPASGSALARVLDDPDPRVREMAALAIGEIGDPAGIDALMAAVDRHGDLRGPVAWALTQIGGTRLVRERGWLRAGVRPPDPEVWAGRLVPSGGTTAGDFDSLLRGLGTAVPAARAAAARGLGRLGDERAVDPLLDALEDSSPEVRAAATWALDEINPSR